MNGNFSHCDQCGGKHDNEDCSFVVTSENHQSNCETVAPVGQAWCLCPYEWGIEDYVTVASSAGTLALCNVLRVVDGANKDTLRYEPVTQGEIHNLSKP